MTVWTTPSADEDVPDQLTETVVIKCNQLRAETYRSLLVEPEEPEDVKPCQPPAKRPNRLLKLKQ